MNRDDVRGWKGYWWLYTGNIVDGLPENVEVREEVLEGVR